MKKHSEKTKQKIRRTMTGKKHSIATKLKIGYSSRNRKHSIATKEKIKQKLSGRRLSILLPQSILKISQKMLGNKNCVGRILSDKTKLKIKTTMINSTKRTYRNTTIEVKIAAELIKRKIKFIQNTGISNIANVDFYLPEYKIVIECDGCFWHACPSHSNTLNIERKKRIQEKDAEKTKKLEIFGMKVFRFWQHEIDVSVSKCINTVFKN